MNEIATFLEYWPSIRARTRRVVLCIPPDQIEWRVGPGRWSLGDTVRHVGALERWMYAEHEAHHRGQLYMKLGTLGVRTPPIFALTEAEVAERLR